MRIVVVNHQFPPYSPSGGGAYNLSREVDLLREFGNHITVVAGHSKRVTWTKSKGLDIVRVPFPDFPPRSLWFQLFNWTLIMNLCKDADVVYSYNGTISLLLSRICQAGVPTVTKVPGLTLSNMFAYLRLPLNAVNPLELFAHFGLQPVYSYLTWLDLRNSTKLVFDSDLSLRRAESFYKIPVRAKSVVISNLAGEFLLRTPRREPKKQVIFVGRLIALKGILDLLEAFSLVVGNSEFADWKLVVLGDGPLRAKVSRRIQELNLKENVTLMGWVDSTEVRKYAAESYLLVHPSYTESDSVTVAEAMALGLPIVVPSEPWASDQTRDYPLRFFFKLGDTHGLARAIENAIRLQLRRVPWARANSQGDALWAVLQQAAHNSLYLPPKPAEHG